MRSGGMDNRTSESASSSLGCTALPLIHLFGVAMQGSAVVRPGVRASHSLTSGQAITVPEPRADRARSRATRRAACDRNISMGNLGKLRVSAYLSHCDYSIVAATQSLRRILLLSTLPVEHGRHIHYPLALCSRRCLRGDGFTRCAQRRS